MGDFAELGVYKGNTAAILAYYAQQFNRKVDLFDTYSGFDQRDLHGIDDKESVESFRDTGLDLVKQNIGENIPFCNFIQGYFPESITKEVENKKYAM